MTLEWDVKVTLNYRQREEFEEKLFIKQNTLVSSNYTYELHFHEYFGRIFSIRNVSYGVTLDPFSKLLVGSTTFMKLL